MKITPSLFQAYIECPTKCWLRFTGEPATGNAYAEWVKTQTGCYRTAAIERMRSNFPPAECIVAPTQESLKTSKWRLGFNVFATTENLETCFPAVERVPSDARGKSALFIPIQLAFTNKVGKDEKLLLAFDAFILSEIIGREISVGKIIHGDDRSTLKVKTSSLSGEIRKRLDKIAALLSSPTPPDLFLNRHCAECEFQVRCRQKAIEKDDLSLLANMSEKERNELRRKGIFTVTQLSYTFRPRRRSRRLREKSEKYHHSLKSLAIREKKIHIVGSLELKIQGTPVYLDVEGLPDRDFYYLIGVRIGNGESAVQHNLWADSVDDEEKIWGEFLAILETVEKPVLIHYGSYETNFLKKMKERCGKPMEGSPVAKAMDSAINLVSVMFAKTYFPTYSNGLKEVAGWLGFEWSQAGSSGTQTICWRNDWAQGKDRTAMRKLIIYNAEDCAALSRVFEVLLHLGEPSETSGRTSNRLAVTKADDLRPSDTMWPTFSSSIPGFEAINKAARWNYQRDMVYIRTDKVVRRAVCETALSSCRSLPINKETTWNGPTICPTCGKSGKHSGTASRILYDLRFSKPAMRTWVTRYIYREYHCNHCHRMYGRPEAFRKGSMYGRNVVATVVYMLIDLCMTQRSIASGLNRLLRLGLHQHEVYYLKGSASRFHEASRQKILAQLLRGGLIHADETSIVVKGERAYVWVFASFREVAYFYAESREGSILETSLNGFSGVLISDFYAAYDSVSCPQQRCLIHLMRDLNDAVLDNPYDEEVKSIVTGFASLLSCIVQTIDRRGLKRHFLHKHLVEVKRFYRQLSRTSCLSEAALKLKERFEKNQDKLFTFLNYDGVPWNNNNAEHAIKAFARLRRAIEGLSTPKGIEEYLILLSVCQTCKYMGVDFLDFLRSGEKDIHAFAENQPKHRRAKTGKPF